MAAHPAARTWLVRRFLSCSDMVASQRGGGRKGQEPSLSQSRPDQCLCRFRQGFGRAVAHALCAGGASPAAGSIPDACLTLKGGCRCPAWRSRARDGPPAGFIPLDDALGATLRNDWGWRWWSGRAPAPGVDFRTSKTKNSRFRPRPPAPKTHRPKGLKTARPPARSVLFVGSSPTDSGSFDGHKQALARRRVASFAGCLGGGGNGVVTLTGPSPQPPGGPLPPGFSASRRVRLWPPLTCDPVTRYAFAGPLCRGPQADVAQALLPSRGVHRVVAGQEGAWARAASGRPTAPGSLAVAGATWGEPAMQRQRARGRMGEAGSWPLPLPAIARAVSATPGARVGQRHGVGRIRLATDTPTGIPACSRGRRGQGAIAQRVCHGLRVAAAAGRLPRCVSSAMRSVAALASPRLAPAPLTPATQPAWVLR